MQEVLRVEDGKYVGSSPVAELDTETSYSILGLGYRRKGDVVWIEGTGQALSIPAKTWTTIGTLPEMYRPEHGIFNIPVTGGSYREYTGVMRIQNGVIEIFANNAADYFIPCISYIAKP